MAKDTENKIPLMNGLVSPVYIINGVVKAIPLIGKGLGGEKGEGIWGFI